MKNWLKAFGLVLGFCLLICLIGGTIAGLALLLGPGWFAGLGLFMMFSSAVYLTKRDLEK
jgi:hypothetical protein